MTVRFETATPPGDLTDGLAGVDLRLHALINIGHCGDDVGALAGGCNFSSEQAGLIESQLHKRWALMDRVRHRIIAVPGDSSRL